VVRNVTWNIAGLLVQTLAGFLIAPYLIRHLGQTTYGLWILIGSLSGYFGLLDLGVRGSVGRHIALYRAKADQQRVNQSLSTGLAYLSAAAALVLLATIMMPFLFFHLVEVPVADADDVRLAVVLMGINLTLALPLSVFDATLWAFQRFDLLNAIDIPTTIVRTVLTFVLVDRGFGLPSLGAITLLCTLASTALKAWFSFRVNRDLRIGLQHVRGRSARELFGYGAWAFVLSLTVVIPAQTFPFVIGICLSLPLVTAYSVAARLITYANQGLGAGMGVLTPVVAALHATQDHGRQQRLLLKGMRYSLGLAIFFLLIFTCLGKPFIRLWIGPSVDTAYLVLVILALGEIVPMSQVIVNSLSLGMGRHRLLAMAGLLEVTTSVCLAIILVRPWGLVGVCLGFVVPGAIFRGMVRWWHGCSLVGIKPGQYLIRVVLPVLAAALVPGTGLVLAARWWPLESWPQLVLCGGAFSFLYAGAFLLIAARDEARAATEAVLSASKAEGVAA
jgi:O-antigen/teichoic acid export membrane protein